MKIANITSTFMDYPTKTDSAILITLVGCKHNCPGCQNKELQNPDYKNATNYNIAELLKAIASMNSKTHTYSKIVFVGGEPLFDSNINELKRLLPHLSELRYDVCIYTGHSLEQAKDKLGDKIKHIKYIKTGLYFKPQAQVPLKNDKKLVFGSANQELYKIESDKIKLVSKNGVVSFD